ncbi:MAG: regulator SirB [Gallionellales bacterium GWA2_60_18]|nr:MAG: regulator SirB [Gallionellales bacterium GWA2_60_18]
MSIPLLKTVHVSCVATSFALFFLRGIWMLRESPLLRRRWNELVPHAVDTLLLASAIALAISTGQYPFEQSWLTTKIFALLLYIVLGAIALKRGRSKAIRLNAWLAAQAVFGYIVLVAVYRTPTPFIH